VNHQNDSKGTHFLFAILFSQEAIGHKCGRTRSFLTGFLFGGIKLKDRSAGGWRSGMQRSEK